MRRFVGLLRKIASRSTNRDGFFHSTLVISGGAVLSFASNSNTAHSEVLAVKKASNPVGSTVINLRSRKNGTIGLSRPCDACMAFLKVSGIKKVVYTNNEGVLVTERL